MAVATRSYSQQCGASLDERFCGTSGDRGTGFGKQPLDQLLASVVPMSAAMVHFCAKSLQFKILPVNVEIQPYPVGIATLKNRTLTPTVQLFVDQIRKVVKPDRKSVV